MKILKFKKSTLSKISSIITTVALVIVTAFGPSLVNAASFTASKDTATRIKISENADHVMTLTMPTGVAFDVGGTQDGFQFDFPATFSQSGTWQTSDFAFSDSNGSHTIEAVSAGAGTITCTSTTADNVCVAIDTTNMIFTVKPSTSYTTSSTGSAITFTILGASGGTGVLTNPSSVAATNIDFKMCNDTASCFTSFTTTDSSQIAFAIVDHDQVTVTAIVGSSITFDIDTDTNPATENGPTYTVPLGTITTADTRISGSTDGVNMIILEGDTSGAGGMVVTVKNANGASGLVSTSTPADNINSSDGTMTTGTTERYGLCVATAALAGFSRASPYNSGSCALNALSDVQGLTTTGEDILNSGGAPVSGGHAEVVVSAEITTATVAHNDYADTLTFIATGTF